MKERKLRQYRSVHHPTNSKAPFVCFDRQLWQNSSRKCKWTQQEIQTVEQKELKTLATRPTPFPRPQLFLHSSEPEELSRTVVQGIQHLVESSSSAIHLPLLQLLPLWSWCLWLLCALSSRVFGQVYEARSHFHGSYCNFDWMLWLLSQPCL